MGQSIVLLLLALLGAPLFAVIAAGALLGFHAEGIDLAVIAIEIYRIADTPVLLAIPLFTFTGYVLSESQASQRLVRLTDNLLNRSDDYCAGRAALSGTATIRLCRPLQSWSDYFIGKPGAPVSAVDRPDFIWHYCSANEHRAAGFD